LLSDAFQVSIINRQDDRFWLRNIEQKVNAVELMKLNQWFLELELKAVNIFDMVMILGPEGDGASFTIGAERP
jgi:Tfp pilus assembly ATPase PilU